MYLITFAPVVPTEKPVRVVCEDEHKLSNVMTSFVHGTASSCLVERVIDSETYGKSVEPTLPA